MKASKLAMTVEIVPGVWGPREPAEKDRWVGKEGG